MQLVDEVVLAEDQVTEATGDAPADEAPADAAPAAEADAPADADKS